MKKTLSMFIIFPIAKIQKKEVNTKINFLLIMNCGKKVLNSNQHTALSSNRNENNVARTSMRTRPPRRPYKKQRHHD